MLSARSTKAGAFTPATLAVQAVPQAASPSLNEGRGVHPGDTAIEHEAPLGRINAQRRPGRSPRRHPERSCAVPGEPCAQRRPGRSPRRHRRSRRSWQVVWAAQRRPGRSPRRHAVRDVARLLVWQRSTKAGAFTPATLEPPAAVAAILRRSTKAGAFTPATPVPLVTVADKRLDRSTKAGAFTPATREQGPPSLALSPSLNEGRGVHPGDTGLPSLAMGVIYPAQRRPGRSPRRHSLPDGLEEAVLPRSTKAGAFTPATRQNRHRQQAAVPSAQRRPGRSPRRHAITSLLPQTLIPAQRRPGRSPRRHLLADRQPVEGVARSTKAGAFTPATPWIRP